MILDIEVSEPSTDAERTAFAEVDLAQLRALADFAGARLHLGEEVELSLAVVTDEQMARLHRQWMDLPGPTDVMSFPMDELRPGTAEDPAAGVLGDVVLCPTVAREQGERAGHGTADELCLLTVHGILHCLGYDHAEPEQEREMFALQRRILEDFLGHPAPVETRH